MKMMKHQRVLVDFLWIIFAPFLASGQPVGWKLGDLGLSCSTVCGSSSCNPDRQNVVNSPAVFEFVASLVGIKCGSYVDGFTSKRPTFDPSTNICTTQTDDASSCQSSFPSARRLCCCAPSSSSDFVAICPTEPPPTPMPSAGPSLKPSFRPSSVPTTKPSSMLIDEMPCIKKDIPIVGFFLWLKCVIFWWLGFG
jgi:hypothetical protein